MRRQVRIDSCRPWYAMLVCEYSISHSDFQARWRRAAKSSNEPMSNGDRITSARDKLLFTPGPLTTSRTVKQAMLRDLGSRDVDFIGVIRSIRNRLLAIAGLSQQTGYECVLMQGSGTYTVESVISSAMPREAKLLVVV